MAQYNYNKLKRPDMPVAIDDTALKNAGAAKTAAATELAGMNYNTFKQGDQYAGLKKSYETQGQRAMQDTLGQIAARTGGMASSYAGSAAQQSYNNYMQTLEDAARSMFNDEYSRAQDRYNMAANDYNTAYGEYRDQYSDAWDRYNAESKVYEDDRNAEIDRVYNSAYYGEAPTFADYKASGGTLDEATYNSIVLQGSGKRTDEGRADVDTEYERIFGAEGFNWDEWLKELDADKDGTTSEDEIGAFFDKSSYDADYWRQFAEDEGRTAAASDIEARIANGESLDDIATSLGISEEPADGDSESLTWQDVTGISEAEWKAFANDNAVKNYTYSNDEKGAAAIVSALINSASTQLSAKDQKNFDYIYGDGAYDAVQQFISNMSPDDPNIGFEVTPGMNPALFEQHYNDLVDRLTSKVPGLNYEEQILDIVEKVNPNAYKAATNPNYLYFKSYEDWKTRDK